MKKVLLFILAFCVPALTIYAQSPGGVTTNLKLWLKANSSVTPSTQGANVTGWSDASGLGNNASYSSSMFSVAVINPTYQQNTINFNPSVHFPGTSATSFSALEGGFFGGGAVTSNNVSAYMVFIVNSAASSSGRVFMISQNGSTSDWQNLQGADFISKVGTSNIYGTRNNISAPQIGPVVGLPVVMASSHFTTANQFRINYNGNAFASSAFTAGNFNSSYYRLGQSTYSANDWFNGDIAEVVLYTSDQSSTSTNHLQIESYLALKYGIHKVGNYVKSDGTVVWNATTNTAYHNDVFGIAQDNASGLLQAQSNSMNTGSGNGTGQNGKGNIVISTPSALTNGSYLIIGHTTDDLSQVSTGLPASSPVTSRINRTWKVQQTGSVGTVSLSFDLAGLTSGIGFNNSPLVLLIDQDGDGNFTTGTVTSVNQTSKTGSVARFDNITLPNNAVFTFGFALPTPGSITGLTLWLRGADALPIAGGTLSNWSEFVGTNAYTISGTQSVVLNAVNFNPAVRFNGSGKLTGNANITMSEFASVVGWIGASTIDRGAVVSPTTNNNAGASRYAFRSDGTAVYTGIFDLTATNGYMNFTPPPPSGEYNILLASGTGNIYRKNAVQVGTGSFPSSFMSGVPQIGDRSTNDAKLSGDIAEIIIYNASQAGIVRNKMESYLAIKYGIHKAGDYIKSDGAVVWDATANAAYHNDVFGIAHDDASGLLQPQSNSMNTGSGNGTGQSGKGNIVISNPSALANGGFLIVGHNTNDFGITKSNIPSIIPADYLRISRSWKVQSTGSVGAINLSFNTTGLSLSAASLATLTLIVDTDGDGDFTTGTTTQYAFNTQANNVSQFNNVSLPNGSVFSFALDVPVSPGGVDNTDLSLWLRADKQIALTDGSSITNWNAYQGGYNVSQSSGSVKYYSSNVQYLVNYQPSVYFPGTGGMSNLLRLFSNTKGFQLLSVGKDMKSTATGGRAISGFGSDGNYPGLDLSGAKFYPYFSFAGGGWGSSTARIYNGAYSGSLPQPQIFGLSAPVGGTITSLVDNFQENTGRTHNQNTNIGNGTYVGSSYDYYWTGTVNEVIAFNRTLTADELLRVNSYLALKFGITLKNASNQTTTSNYLSTSGQIIWNSTTNNGFNNNVAGIGRDDQTDLYQKQSRSANNNKNQADPMSNGNMLAIGLGSVAVTNEANGNTFATNNTFILWGDNGINGVQSTQVPSSATLYGTPGLNVQRAKRVWKVQATGTAVSNLQLKFFLQDAGLPLSNIQSFKLLINNSSSDFTNADNVFTASTYDVTARTVTFNNIPLTNGQYFTLVTQANTAPGGVGNGLVSWFRADDPAIALADNASIAAGGSSTPTSGTVIWPDFVKGPTGGLFSGTGTKKYYLTTAANLVNFNPSFQFSNSGSGLVNYNNFISNTSGFHLLTVARDEAASQGTLRSSGSVGVNGNGFALDMQRDGTSPTGYNHWMDSSSPGEYGGGNFMLYNGSSVSNFGRIPQIYGMSSTNESTTIRNNVYAHLDNYTQITPLDAYRQSAIGGGLFLGSSNDAPWTGTVNEYILYNRKLSSIELFRVNTYLAIKYGITLRDSVALPLPGTPNSNGAVTTLSSSGGNLSVAMYTPSAYMRSDSTIIWDINKNVNYTYNVSGIGRDDRSALVQLQSASQNNLIATPAFTNQAVDFMYKGNMLSVGVGAVANSNNENPNSFIDDGDFTIWGDDGNRPEPITTNLPNQFAACLGNQRLGRQWKTQVTGNSYTNLTLKFNLSGISGITGTRADQMRLIIDEDGNGDFSSGKIRVYQLTSYASSLATVDNVQLKDGEVFTLLTNTVEDGIAYLVPTASNLTTNQIKCNGNTGFRYFYESSATTPVDGNGYGPFQHKVFAIDGNGNAINNFTGFSTVINTNNTPASLNKSSTTSASALMNRLVQVNAPAASYAVNGGVRIRLYYSQAELETSGNFVADFQAQNDINASIVQSWFKAENTIAGVVGGLTPEGLPGNYQLITPDSTGVEDGVSFVEFWNITNFSTFGYISSVVSKLSVSGKVWIDANGSITQDGTEGNYTGSTPLYATIVDSGNNFVSSVPVDASGNYHFEQIVHQRTPNYSILISTTLNATTVSLPSNYISTGQDSSGKTLTTPLGIIHFNTQTADINNLNFGIEQLPLTNDVILTNVSANLFTDLTIPEYLGIPMSNLSSLNGSDAEDCPGAGTCASGTGSTFVIGTVNSNTKLVYNGQPLINGSVIVNFNASLLTVYGINQSGETGDELGFTYTLRDAANRVSPTLGIYSITTTFPLQLPPELEIRNLGPVCVGTTVNLKDAIVSFANVAPGDVPAFYTDGAATNAVTDTLVTVSSTTVYYVKLTNSISGVSVVKTDTVFAYSLPNLVISQVAPDCNIFTEALPFVDITQPAVTAGSDAGTLSYWVDGSALLALINPNAITLPGTYYIKLQDANGCSTIKPYTIDASMLLKPTLVITNPLPKCQGEAFDLTDAAITVGSSVGIQKSYYQSDGTTPVATPTAVTVAGTFYIGALDQSGNGCSILKPVTLTFKANTTAAVIVGGTFEGCPGDAVVLSVSAPTLTAPIFKWYFDAALTDPVPGITGNGSSYTATVGTASTTFYVTAQDAVNCENNPGDAAQVVLNAKAKATAADIQGSGVTVCAEQPVILTVSTSTINNPLYNWYDNPGLTGTPVSTSSSYTTPPLTQTTSYYITASGTNLCPPDPANVKVITVTVNTIAVASDITVINQTDQLICAGSSARLKAISAINSPVYTWYSDFSLLNQVGTGPDFDTGNLNATTTYYVTVSGDGVCENKPGQGTPVTVTVKQNATETDITAADAVTCIGQPTQLSATSSLSNVSFKWYSDANLTTVIGNGPTVTIPPIAATSTFYVTASTPEVCENLPGTAKAVVVTLNRNASETDIQSSDPTICAGTSTTLTVTSSVVNPVFKWYTDNSRTILLTNGSQYTTPVLTNTTSYFVTVSGDGVCEGSASAVEAGKVVTVTVNPQATATSIVANDQSICSNTAAILSASAAGIANPLFKWYRDAALTQFVASGATYTTPLLTQATTYYVTVTGDGICENDPGNAKAVTVSILRNATAADISTTNQTICSGANAVLQASSSGISGATFNWYSDIALTNLVFTGANFTTPNLTATTTYYVTASSPIVCENNAGEAKAVTVTVLPFVAETAISFTGSNFSVCNGSKAFIKVNATGVVNPIYNWYTNADKTGFVTTGASFQSVPLSANTTYYVFVSGANICESGPFTWQVTVLPLTAAADIQATVPVICNGSTATITVSSPSLTNPAYYWYDQPNDPNTYIAKGSTFVTPPLTATTTYYARVISDNTCLGEAKAITVIVNPNSTAADIVTQSARTCANATAQLSASLAATSTIINPVFRWYRFSDNVLVNTGATYTPPIQTVENSVDTYKVTVSGDNSCERLSNYATVSLFVSHNTVAADINVADQTICSNSTATLTINTPTITGSSNRIKIYSDNTLTNLLYEAHGTGSQYETSYTTPALSQTTTYYITALSNTDCENVPGAAKAVTITVNQLPTLVVNPVDINCDSATDNPPSLDLTNPSVTNGSDPGILSYWLDATASNPLINPELVTSPGTYYIMLTDANGCFTVQPYVFDPVQKPSLVITDPAPVCSGTSVDLTAAAITAGSTDGIQLQYYADANAVQPLADPTAITQSGTYYISATIGGNGCNRIKPVNVVINPKAQAADIIAADQTICSGEQAILSAQSLTHPEGVINWYSDAALNNLVATGTNFTTPILSATTLYYLTVSDNITCANDPAQAKVVTVTVNRIASQNDITVNTTPICNGTITTLTATSTTVPSPVFNWYSDAALTNLVSSSSTFTTPALTNTTTYYVTVSGINVCKSQPTSAKAVTVVVFPKATASDINAGPVTICNGQSATIAAWTTTVNNPVFKWYSSSDLSNLVFTGPTFTTPALSVSTNYYVTVSGNGICDNDPVNAKAVVVTVNRNSTAADISANDATICTGASAILRASSSVAGPIFKWYQDQSLSTLLFTGANFTTPPLSVNTTYYVTVSGNGVCEGPAGEVTTGKAVTVTVQPKAQLADVTVTSQEICLGEDATLTATSTIVNPVFKWYTDAALTNLIASGNTYIATGLSTTTSYYVTVQGDGVCESEMFNARIATVTVKRIATVADIITNNTQICTGNSVQLQASTASVTNPVFSWYDNPALTGTPVATGSVFTTPSLTNSTTYYIKVEGDGVCGNLSNNGKAVTVVVDRFATATDITISGTTEICTSATTTLTATSTTITNPVFNWYTNASLTGSPLFTGSVFVTPPLVADTTYYVSVTGDGVCENQGNTAKAIVVKVNRFASDSDIQVEDTQICSNTRATLVASSTTISNPLFTWYDNPGLTGSPVGAGATFVTPLLTATKAYYVTVSGSGVCTNTPNNAKVVLVTVNRYALSSDIQAENDSTCYNTGTTLIATSSIGNAQFKWFDNPNLTGTPLSTTAIYTTPNLVATTTYYVTVRGNGVCESQVGEAKPVTLTVIRNATDADIAVNNAVICNGEQTTLTATSSTVTGAVFKWYNNADLQGIPVHIGASFTTPSLTSTTNYYVTVTGNEACENLSGNAKIVTVVVQRYADLNDLITKDTIICSGASAVLNVSSNTLTNPVFEWYDNADLTGTPLFTGTQFTTPALTANTTYFVSVVGDGVCKNQPGAGKSVTVIVNRIASAADITASDATICAGTQTVLTASSVTVSGTVFNWYADAALTQLLGSGNSYTTPSLTTSTTYYVAVSGTGVCQNAAGAGHAVTVTVTPHATATDLTANGTSICQGTSTSLSASSTLNNPVIRWYDNASLSGSPVFIGSSFNTPALTATTTYYVTAQGDAVCESLPSDAVAVTVTVNRYATSADISGSGVEICSGQTASLSVTSSLNGAQFNWYDNAALSGSPIATGTSFITPVLTTTTNYYVTVSGSDVCANQAGAAKVLTVTVDRNATAADLTVADATICNGQTALLSAESTLSGAVFNWYSDASLSNLLASGESFSTPVLNTTTTYYVTVSANGVCENNASAAHVVTVTVNRLGSGADIASNEPTICSGETASLTASSSVQNPVFRWYTDSSLGTLLSTGPNFTTPVLTATTSYYVTVSGDGVCEGPAGAVTTGKQVTVTVNRIAVAADISLSGPSSICSGDQTTLTATSSTVTNPVFNWYADASLTQFLASGDTFSTPSLTAGTTYYVTVSGANACSNTVTSAASIQVVVNRHATATDITSTDQVICSGQSATLTVASALTSPVFNWYSDAALTNQIATNVASFTTPALTTGTVYYVTVSNGNVCANTITEAKAVSVTVNRVATTADLATTDQTICGGSTATLVANTTTVTNPVFNWYSDAGLTNQVAANTASFTTPALSANTTYYVTVSSDDVCENMTSVKDVNVTVNRVATASDIIIADQTICSGSTATLTASSTTVTDPVFDWYSDAALTQKVFTGAVYNTPSLTSTTNYYVTVSGSGVCSNTTNAQLATVTVNKNANANDIAANDQLICYGDSTLVSVSSTTITNPIFNWYTDADLTNLIFTGNSLNTGALTATTTYYVTVSGDAICSNQTGAAKVITINVINTPIITRLLGSTQTTICSGESTVLSANVAEANPSFVWYADSALTIQVGTGSTFTTPVLTGTTTYYVTVSGPTICAGSVRRGFPVRVIVNPRSTAADIIVADASICKGSSVQLMASSTTVPNPVFNWYTDSLLTNSVFTGSAYTTPVLTQNRTFYVTVSDTSICENVPGEAKAVQVTITPNATASDINASDALICGGSTAQLTASSTIANATFNWYADAALTQQLASTASFATPVLAQTTTYYVTVSGTGICSNMAGNAKPATAIVQPNALASSFTVNTPTVCEGATAQLQATSTTLRSPIYKWYSDAALTNLLATGPNFTTNNLAVTTTYYVTVSATGYCESTPATAKQVTVNVNRIATQADIIVNDVTICSGAGATLTASSTTVINPVYTWYDDAALTTVIQTGSQLVVPGITSSKTYYVTVNGENVCANQPAGAKVVNVTIENVPSVSITSVPAPEDLFIGQQFTMTANVNGSFAGLEWYKDGVLIPGASNQTSLIIPDFKATDQGFYQVEVITANGCRSLSRERGLSVVLSPSDFHTWKLVTDASGDGIAQAGEELTYVIHLKNTGSQLLQTVSISDPLPRGTTYISGGTFNGTTINFTASNLAIDEERIYSFIVKSVDDLTGITAIVNQATVTANGLNKLTSCSPDSINECATVIPAFQPVTAYNTWKEVVDASGDGQVQLDEELTYTIHVLNTGNLPIAAISVLDSIPAGTTYISGSGGTLTDSVVVFTSTNLALNEEQTFTFKVKAESLFGKTLISNQAHVNGDNVAHPTSCTQGGSPCRTDIPIDPNTIFNTPLSPPNVFTPNGDGINDLFVIQGLENHPGSKLVIINRWGNQVYQNDNYQNDWDGSQLPEGVYFYLLKLNDNRNVKRNYSGYIELLRSIK